MAHNSGKKLVTPACVVHDAKQDFTLVEDVVLENPQDDEILVEMKFSGEIRLCKYPAIFGHEGAGIVRSIGSKVENLDIGDFVLLSINFCEKCKFCRRDHSAECVEGTRLHLFGVRDDGSTAATLPSGESVRSHFFGQSSFSRFSYVHKTCIVKHPNPEDADKAAMYAAMGCGYQTGIAPQYNEISPIAAADHKWTGAGPIINNILKPEPDSSIVIYGLVTVGLTALMAAKYLGVQQINAVDIQENKFALATELGATLTTNSRGIDLVAKIKELSGGGVDYAIDCTGAPVVIEAMLRSLGMRGPAATVGLPPGDAEIQINPMRHLLGSRRYLGFREGDSVPTEFIPQMIEMHRAGAFPVEKLITVTITEISTRL